MTDLTKTILLDLPPSLAPDSLAYVLEQLGRSFSPMRLEQVAGQLCMEVDNDLPDDVIQQSFRTFLSVGERIKKVQLYQFDNGTTFHQDPQPELEKSGQVISYGDGLFSFQGQFQAVMKMLEEQVLTIARKFNAVEQEHPSVWPVDLYKRIDYFSEYPHHAMLMTAVKEDYGVRSEFAKRFGKRNAFDDIAIDQTYFDSVRFGAPNACCDLCYYSLRGAQLEHDKVFTTVNRAVRNECSASGGLERLRNFKMREVVFVGSAGFVQEKRQQVIDQVIDLLKKLELSVSVETAHDPFFGNDTAVKNIFQYISNVKFEMLARLNFSGKNIAVGSINWHLDFFGKAFDIKATDNEPAQSSCVGFGFERFVYALYCQFGLNVSEWPKSTREVLGV